MPTTPSSSTLVRWRHQLAERTARPLAFCTRPCCCGAQEFDGSDSGAKPDEAVSWGKVRMDATPVKVHADATLIMPLLIAQTFAKEEEEPAEAA